MIIVGLQNHFSGQTPILYQKASYTTSNVKALSNGRKNTKCSLYVCKRDNLTSAF